ncbi:M24 family metallopeptidase [Fuchsiella alkaliacetigena]|uniref:M24 family metallopeptidase n=1 Tax=Fuchsiella alkaliacetigena TaxID=957042 RepID=UPI00200B72AB|nr:Xaa-Pro peptidase family protein [Fuchsiella alkaliacetigena]MCK8825296.1 Xaa-Pro peptidase family protein [Fuchsiella alkaliacetigena]
MKERVIKLRKKISEIDIDGIMINNPNNTYYLSGFTGTAATLLITDTEKVLITDFRYQEQALNQTTNYRVVEHGQPKIKTLKEELKRLEVKKLGFEAKELSYQQYSYCQKKLAAIELVATKDLVKEIRLIKDAQELLAIEKAVELADQAFEHILDYIKPGVKEKELSLELEYFMKKQGASDKAFDFIVASGQRGALPHGVASDKELVAGELVTFDLGCTYDNYNSDFTRTVVLGEPTARQKEIYDLVLTAQLEALAVIGPSKSGAEVDSIAREIIAKQGYGDNFGHSLGHGVGLEVHEGPRLAKGVAKKLKTGMVVTVEPGIYVQQWGGVRIEDIVVITEEGARILTQSTKELLQI